MRKYRLKREALPYYDEKFGKEMRTLEGWHKENVSEKALEEIEEVYIDYGHRVGTSRTDLCGWSSRDGSYYNFAIKFPHIDYSKNKKIEKLMAELMRDIQDIVNKRTKEILDN